jgi:hypothetical protein
MKNQKSPPVPPSTCSAHLARLACARLPSPLTAEWARPVSAAVCLRVPLLSLCPRARPASRSRAPVPRARGQWAVGPARQLRPLPCNRALPLSRAPSRTHQRSCVPQQPPAYLAPIPPPALPPLLGHLICIQCLAHPLSSRLCSSSATPVPELRRASSPVPPRLVSLLCPRPKPANIPSSTSSELRPR